MHWSIWCWHALGPQRYDTLVRLEREYEEMLSRCTFVSDVRSRDQAVSDLVLACREIRSLPSWTTVPDEADASRGHPTAGSRITNTDACVGEIGD